VSHLVAVLDANVLVPENLGSFLATSAFTGLFTPVISLIAIDEVIRNFPIAENRMNNTKNAFASQIISLSTEQIASVSLKTSPEDAHIVAAAIATKANVIVTSDVALLQEVNELDELKVSALYPFEFLTLSAFGNPRAMKSSVELMTRMRKKPSPWTSKLVIQSLIDESKPWNAEFIRILERIVANEVLEPNPLYTKRLSDL
jgi:predicted nucleic acid-binding protein